MRCASGRWGCTLRFLPPSGTLPSWSAPSTDTSAPAGQGWRGTACAEGRCSCCAAGAGRSHQLCSTAAPCLRRRWLLKRLEARKEIWAIFPPGWHVPQLLCIMFCNITKTMLAEILDLKVGAALAGRAGQLLSGCRSVLPAASLAPCLAVQSAELPSQVDALLKSVEATNIFEAEMARRFEGAVEREPSEDADAGGGGDAPADDSTPASRVRQRYEKLAREKQRAVESESPERRKEQVGGCVLASCRCGRACAQRGAGTAPLPCHGSLPRRRRTHCMPRTYMPAGARDVGGGGQDQLPGRHLLCVCALPQVRCRAVPLRCCVPPATTCSSAMPASHPRPPALHLQRVLGPGGA